MSKNFLTMTFSLLVSFTSSVGNAKTIFYCETENGKQVEVQTIGEYVHYRFGEKLYQPEIELTVNKDDSSTYQWFGVGSTEYYDVGIPNQNTTYKVFTSRERRPEGKYETGISVWNKDKVIAHIYCRNGSLHENLIGVDLPEE